MTKSSKSPGRRGGPARFLLLVPLLTVAVAACGGGAHGDKGSRGAPLWSRRRACLCGGYRSRGGRDPADVPRLVRGGGPG